MIDREKIIKEFEKICEYTLRPHEFQVLNDVLALLKEQESKPIRYKENWMTGLPVAHCPKCGKALYQVLPADEDETKFCPWCGQAVKWIQ